MPDPPSMIGGRYRVIRELGRGGMGAVYLVEHVHTGEQLALKVLLGQEALHPEAVERFKREARAPAKIRSDHVVRVSDADVAPELNGAPFMVMEALNGKDLGDVLLARGAIPPPEVAWILQQIAPTLDKAHGLGIVHRDLKPENLFLHSRDDGTKIVKLLDFGISKVIEKGGDIATAGLTKTGAVMGTPLFMAPEQARGVTNIGPASDIWSLGLVTLRLLSNDIYWEADTLADLLVKILVEPMPPPSIRHPKLPVNIDAWFARACARDPASRFPSVGEQVRAFTAIVGGERPALGTSAVSSTVVLGAGSMPNAANSTGPNFQPAPPSYPQSTGPRLEHSSSPQAAAMQMQATTGSGITRSNAGVPAAGPKPGLVIGALVGALALAAVGGFGIHYRATHSGPMPSATVEPPPAVSTAPPPVASSVAHQDPPPPEPPPASAKAPIPAAPSHAPVIASVTSPPAKPAAPIAKPSPAPAPKGAFNPEAP
jgi:serine/threonine-protein kinase